MFWQLPLKMISLELEASFPKSKLISRQAMETGMNDFTHQWKGAVHLFTGPKLIKNARKLQNFEALLWNCLKWVKKCLFFWFGTKFLCFLGAQIAQSLNYLCLVKHALLKTIHQVLGIESQMLETSIFILFPTNSLTRLGVNLHLRVAPNRW